ncbi:hypothetical protein SLS62_004171 [Diatrype stigma]|uniref:DUF3533 domain-containing protein n=1 Tax=Diatrype stigma TaxID=117547 RepID=A0AAN9UX17_9PEZI
MSSSHPAKSPPDASGLVIAAARGPPDYATGGNESGGGDSGDNTARDGRGSYFASNGALLVSDDPHDYDRDEEEKRRPLEESLQRQPHRSVGFWDPKMNQVRKTVIKQWAAMAYIHTYFRSVRYQLKRGSGLFAVTFLVCAIMAILALYWADLFVVDQKLRNLTVHVVDLDGQAAPYNDSASAITPLVGPTMTSLARELADGDQPSLGYVVVPAAAYGHDARAVRQAVYDWECYAAVVIQANATALLQAAAARGNASYDPTGAVQIVLLSARQEATYYNYILPQLEALARDFSARFAARWAAELLADGAAYPREALARAPAAVNPGVAPVQLDLRPFQPAVATPAVSIGLIYLIIMAFFSFGFFMPIHSKYIQPHGHPPLHYWQYIIWRLCATITAYLFISLAYSLVSLAFQIPFWPGPASQTDVAFSATAYGRGSFPVYWMVNFVGMNALGIACENVAMVIGQPWTALWLIFWVITNVATSFYSIELAPNFFRWGYAWPLYHVVMASRQILFDLHSRIGLNFGVLFAWAAVNVTLFPFCCYIMRWKMERGQRRSSEERQGDTYTIDTGDGEKVEYPKEKGAKPPKKRRGFMRGM